MLDDIKEFIGLPAFWLITNLIASIWAIIINLISNKIQRQQDKKYIKAQITKKEKLHNANNKIELISRYLPIHQNYYFLDIIEGHHIVTKNLVTGLIMLCSALLFMIIQVFWLNIVSIVFFGIASLLFINGFKLSLKISREKELLDAARKSINIKDMLK